MSKSFVFPEEPERRPVLVAGTRTPFQKAGTGLKRASAADLGVWALKELLAQSEVDVRTIDEVIFGCVGQASSEANVSRVISLRSGIPQSTPAYSVHRNCASGLQSIEEAARRIASGEGSVYIAGGTESMSSYPLLMGEKLTAMFERLMKSRSAMAKIATLLSFRPSFLKPRISLLEGLTDPVCGLIMGLTAEKLAHDFGVTRAEQDAFALESHRKAVRAWEAGDYEGEVFSLFPPPSFKPQNQDNGPRAEQSIEALQKLKPYFDRREGSVTVGNSCPVTDGAVALLIMSEAAAKAAGYEPMAKLVSTAVSGLAPDVMGLGPAYAAPAAIAAKGIDPAELDVWEINEAFSAQVLACLRALDSKEFSENELGLGKPFGAPDIAKVNPRGGAVAIGHPVGATGSRLVLALVNQLRAKGGGLGVATLCIGGGQGAAQVWEAA